jgi:subtilisin family serine protease
MCSRNAYEDRANRATQEWVAGATNPRDDFIASFSNYAVAGEPSVNIFAPGVSILVADRFNPGYSTTLSGTSFSAPYVAGVIAQYLQTSPTASVNTVYAAINNYMVMT